MSVVKKLRGFEFSAAEYAVNPEDVLARAKAYAQIGPDDDLRELEMFLRCKYTGKKMESVRWEPMVGPLENGGRLVGRIGNLVVSGTVAISPKTVEVHMDLPREGAPIKIVLQMLAPVIFTEEPHKGSPANEYGLDVSRRMLLDSYYASLAKFT